MTTPDVCVIIAAFHAERTVARAVRSALAEPEVAEVVLVDDASTDATVATAQAADDGSGRLHIIRQPRNHGPAAARNRAIAESRSAYIAVLDSDDYLLPGRFAAMLATPDWDLIADNVAFVQEAFADRPAPLPPAHANRVTPLALTGFVAGNLSRRDRPRGELGFLKPVLRREMLDRHGLRYDENLRLGEDYALYIRLLATGARFLQIRSCGYVAVERAISLSGRHSTQDLAALAGSERAFLRDTPLGREEQAMVQRHLRQIEARHHHRHMLDIRRSRGRFGAAAAAIARPLALPGLVASVLRDKLGRPMSKSEPGEVRYLFT